MIISTLGMNILYLLCSQYVDEEVTILLVISTHFRSCLQQTVCLPRTSTVLVYVYTILQENEEWLRIQRLSVFKVTLPNSNVDYTVSCKK
jgi:hypothetical protein